MHLIGDNLSKVTFGHLSKWLGDELKKKLQNSDELISELHCTLLHLALVSDVLCTTHVKIDYMLRFKKLCTSGSPINISFWTFYLFMLSKFFSVSR